MRLVAGERPDDTNPRMGLLSCWSPLLGFLSSQLSIPPIALRRCSFLGVIFYLIICGSSVFGLLLTRPARRLGDISYGIYLLQGLVLYFVFSIGPVRAFALVSPAQHWSVICICALLLTACAALAHRWIELPGIRLGKSVAAILQSAGDPEIRTGKRRQHQPSRP